MKLYLPSPDIISSPDTNLILKSAAALAALSSGIGGIAIWMAVANQRLSVLINKHFRRQHTVVLGDIRIAQLLQMSGRIHPSAIVHRTDALGPLDNAPSGSYDLEAFSRDVGLKRASRLVIGVGDDNRTLSLAVPLLRTIEGRRDCKLEVIGVQLSDPVLCDLLMGSLQAGGSKVSNRIVLFDLNRALARRILAAHPLFIEAAAREQHRVHALIVGSDGLGEHLMDQVMLTCVAGDLDTPRVTFLVRDARTVERKFRARRPRVADTLLISFVELDVRHDPFEWTAHSSSHSELDVLLKQDPATAVLIADQLEIDRLGTAVMMQSTFVVTTPVAVPIFVPTNPAESTLLKSTAEAAKRCGGIIPIPILYPELAAELLLDAGSENLARRLHQGYRSGDDAVANSDVPWDYLPEKLRRANLRAADHLPAKLWTIGFNAKSATRPLNMTRSERAELKEALSMDPETDLWVSLARIEHARWVIDRKLDGWIYGRSRSNQNKVHPLLVPYEELKKSKGAIAKDVLQVRGALQYLLDESS